jgi:hypothetical protein
MCLNVLGVHAVVVWQWLQSKLFTGNAMWPVFVPVAVVPLWHDAQLPVMPVWLNAAGVHARVEWQALHSCVVGIWLVGLPVAATPLWQLVQVPTTWA